MTVNKVILVGNLGADPEVRYAPDGTCIANVSVATSESWKDKATGERKEATEWHRVSFFGKLAEVVAQYLKKGSQVFIEGRLRTRKWQDQEGKDRYTTEVRADEMKMLGKRGDNPDADASAATAPAAAAPAARQAAAPRAQPAPAMNSGGFGDFDDDIPF